MWARAGLGICMVTNEAWCGGVPHQAQRCRDSHKGQGNRAEGLGFLSITPNLFSQRDWKSLLVTIKSKGL